jgi:hypothetical protein
MLVSFNMQEIKIGFEKDFIMAIKSNRLVALSLEERKKGRFVRIDSLQLEQAITQLGNEKGLDFQVLLTKQVFKNKDVSRGYFVSGFSFY